MTDETTDGVHIAVLHYRGSRSSPRSRRLPGEAPLYVERREVKAKGRHAICNSSVQSAIVEFSAINAKKALVFDKTVGMDSTSGILS